jgi:hypothetical protein
MEIKNNEAIEIDLNHEPVLANGKLLPSQKRSLSELDCTNSKIAILIIREMMDRLETKRYELETNADVMNSLNENPLSMQQIKNYIGELLLIEQNGILDKVIKQRQLVEN